MALLFVLAVPAASATTKRILAPMDWWPVWSPGGARIAFTRIYANHMELYTVSVGKPGSPAWSHDGSRIAYVQRGTLYTVAADGKTAPKIVTRNVRASGAPSWSRTDAKVTVGGAWSPTSDAFVAPGPRPSCPGH